MFVGSKLGVISPVAIRSASMTGGLVGHSQHAVLPSISPLATLILTLLGMLVSTTTRLRYFDYYCPLLFTGWRCYAHKIEIFGYIFR